jgi:hypothetical protein
VGSFQLVIGGVHFAPCTLLALGETSEVGEFLTAPQPLSAGRCAGAGVEARRNEVPSADMTDQPHSLAPQAFDFVTPFASAECDPRHTAAENSVP